MSQKRIYLWIYQAIFMVWKIIWLYFRLCLPPCPKILWYWTALSGIITAKGRSNLWRISLPLVISHVTKPQFLLSNYQAISQLPLSSNRPCVRIMKAPFYVHGRAEKLIWICIRCCCTWLGTHQCPKESLSCNDNAHILNWDSYHENSFQHSWHSFRNFLIYFFYK